MATMTLCNTVLMLMLLAALSTCHGNAFGAWSGKQRQRKKSWLFTERGLGFRTAGSGTRTRDFRVSSPALCHATNQFLDQSVLADFDPRKKKEPHFKTRSLSGTSNNNINNKELYNNSNNNHYNHDNNNTSIFEVVSDFVTENTTSTTKVFGELHSMYFFPEEFNSHTRESQEPCFWVLGFWRLWGRCNPLEGTSAGTGNMYWGIQKKEKPRGMFATIKQ